MGLPSFWPPMLAPFTRLRVASLAEFSARLPQGTPSDATNEGIAMQCFQKVMHMTSQMTHPRHPSL